MMNVASVTMIELTRKWTIPTTFTAATTSAAPMQATIGDGNPVRRSGHGEDSGGEGHGRADRDVDLACDEQQRLRARHHAHDRRSQQDVGEVDRREEEAARGREEDDKEDEDREPDLVAAQTQPRVARAPTGGHP